MSSDHSIRVSVTTVRAQTASLDRVNLRVEDWASGEVLADVEMTSGRFWRLCQGGEVTIPDSFISDKLNRVGCPMNVEQLPIPSDVTARILKPDEQIAAVKAWLADNAPAYWEETDVQLSNRGPVAIGRWWPGSTGIAVPDGG